MSAGCTMFGDGKNLEEGVDIHRLDAEWLPLEQLRERPSALLPGSVTTTVGERAYVADVEKWLEERPIDSPRYRATLAHEQEHAKRQLAHGVTTWIAKYLYDQQFMWAEEQRGWYISLRAYRRSGLRVNPEAVAKTLNGYKNLQGTGRWRPPED
jgi:hypothetical protein